MDPEETFTGFPTNGLEFLVELEKNNDKEWFQAHKQEYLDEVVVPAQAFIMALGEKLCTISDEITYDTRASGSGSLMRIHRDVRFSKDKTPYHTRVRIIFWYSQGHRTGGPGFHMGFNHEGGGLYAGQYVFQKPMLMAFREAVLHEKLGPELVDVIDSVKRAGDYEIGGEHYKRVPPGFDPNHERSDLLRYAGLYAHTTDLDPEIIVRPEFVDFCYAHFKNMSPVVMWLIALVRRIQRGTR